MYRHLFKSTYASLKPITLLQLIIAAVTVVMVMFGSVTASQGNSTDTQIELTTKQIEEYLSGFFVKGVFHDTPWTSYFSPSGSTTYQVPNSRPSTGQWQAKDDTYCSMWPPSNTWGCYRVTAFENQMTFIPLDGGDHWPGERTTEK